MVGRTTRKLACIRIRLICKVKSVGKAVLNIKFIEKKLMCFLVQDSVTEYHGLDVLKATESYFSRF